MSDGEEDGCGGCGASKPRAFINEGLKLTSSREAWTLSLLTGKNFMHRTEQFFFLQPLAVCITMIYSIIRDQNYPQIDSMLHSLRSVHLFAIQGCSV
jgi:hypothetical protein